MRVVDTRFMNWVDFDALRKETDLVLMPFGAVEVYGPHLPMGADGIATSALAERVAAEEPAFVAPLIPVGYSKALADFPGTLNVRPSSLTAYARDVAESYIGWGCKRILFSNDFYPTMDRPNVELVTDPIADIRGDVRPVVPSRVRRG